VSFETPGESLGFFELHKKAVIPIQAKSNEMAFIFLNPKNPKNPKRKDRKGKANPRSGLALPLFALKSGSG
jgi:hypothetical protein